MQEHGRSILLVEDDEAFAELFFRAARKRGSGEVLHHLKSGAKALEYLEECKGSRKYPDQLPCLILLDLRLPGKDGLDVLAAIKADPALKHIPVVVLSQYSSTKDLAEAYDRGANGYLSKPSGTKQLEQMVGGLIGYWMGCNRLSGI